MRFKLDENPPVELADMFRKAGHDAVTVLDQDLAGARDADLASVCVREGRIIVTFDMDFANIRTYPPITREIGLETGLIAGEWMDGLVRIVGNCTMRRSGNS